jgi:hypothetical protein
MLGSLDRAQKTAFEKQLAGRNLEQALSRLRRIAALLHGSDGKVDGLTSEEAAGLDRSVCRSIVSSLDIKDAHLGPMLRFVAWAARTDYLLPLELFSVNYDLLLETALEALGVAYFDGFSGALRARFRIEIVEAEANAPGGLPAFIVRVWKRTLLRPCLDWTERRPHLAGALGAALTSRLFELDWIRRLPGSCAVRVTPRGEAQLLARFAVARSGAPYAASNTSTPEST